jgi:hypothetical protein
MFDVQHDDLGLQNLRELDGLHPVLRLADYLDGMIALEHAAHSLADRGVVVGQKDAVRRAFVECWVLDIAL